jgi:hypothetical protein
MCVPTRKIITTDVKIWNDIKCCVMSFNENLLMFEMLFGMQLMIHQSRKCFLYK